jgi:uncharacterized membrane protein HdeD (DUF308 family)|tara:strand:+ start:470 stop:682 length:213 start_codon:yes stop_codon:yes gene_type:complete
MGILESISKIQSVGMGVVLIVLGLVMLYANVMAGGLMALAFGVFSIMQSEHKAKKATSRFKGDILKNLIK